MIAPPNLSPPELTRATTYALTPCSPCNVIKEIPLTWSFRHPLRSSSSFFLVGKEKKTYKHSNEKRLAGHERQF